MEDPLQDIRRSFDLPDGEPLVDECSCALSKRILLHGRMYIFDQHVCFTSNLFGWVKQKVIPLHQIKDIKKKRNCGFPNSIQITWKKKEFFTSFQNRDDFYDLLYQALKRIQKDPLSSVEELEANNQIPNSRISDVSSSNSSDVLECGTRTETSTKSKKDESEGCNDDSDVDDDEATKDVWTVIQSPAPSIPESMEFLIEDSFDVPVQEFFSCILSVDSLFLENYHQNRGDSRYIESEWKQLQKVSGFVRQATFVSPVKGVRCIGFMSPKQTECSQDHRLCVYEGDHLIFQISQVSLSECPLCFDCLRL